MADWNRRQLLISGATAAGGLALPRAARAASPSERRFLFVFASGGWDVVWALAPMFDNPKVWTPDDGSAVASAGDLTYVDGPDRPSVRSFMDRYADRVSVVHGIEVRSIAHDNCRRLIMTGTTDNTADDWPAIIASQGVGSGLWLPHLVVSGPTYAAARADKVARVGSNGQLGSLLDGSALDASDQPVAGLDPGVEDLVQSALGARLDRVAVAAPESAAEFHARHLSVWENVRALDSAAASGGLNLTPGESFPERLNLALDVLEDGVSRCAIVRHNGYQDLTWDSHGGIGGQTLHWQDLFSGLETLMEQLQSRRGPVGGRLIDDTVVVVFSEMARHPVLNSLTGKDHWTWTSAMMFGAGIQGGRMIGEYDSNVFGRPVDLVSGEVTDSGETLRSGHFGATLLALAGVDPGLSAARDRAPIEALIA